MNPHRIRSVFALFVLLSATVFAAVPASRPYVSPEIHPDRTVTFRILAPKAAEVTLEGGWMAPNQTIPMVKDDKGLWSVTVGPLRPTVYAYWFNLDGAVVLDQANDFVRGRTVASSTSMVDVPDTSPLPWSMRDVPHGTVEEHWVASKVFAETRQIWVYLPPGYAASTASRYPILYLFHGAGEQYFSWVQSGKANLIFDNLLAAGKMKPMVVVMPYTGPSSNPAVVAVAPPMATPGGAPNPAAQEKPRDYILNEVMPWAEARYRILPGRTNRAIAGLSAGGALTATIGFAHLDLFSQMGIFSAPTQAFNFRFANIANDPKGTNARLSVLWLGVGSQDPLAPGFRTFHDQLDKDGIHSTYMETEGAHDWAVWRWCLVQFVPLLFHAGA